MAAILKLLVNTLTQEQGLEESASPCQLGSTVHTGIGIFATRTILAGEAIGRITGPVREHVNATIDDVLGHERWIGLGNNRWIEPAFPFSHINHSCNPNAGIRGADTMTAIRDIAIGEEITFDYATSEEDARWFMRCDCHEPTCRKEVRSIHFLPRENFERYLPCIPDHFQQVYRAYHSLPDNPR